MRSCPLGVSVPLTCQSEQRGLAEAVGVSVLQQVEADRRGVQEEARFGVGLQRVVAGGPCVPVEDEGGPVPECIALLPFGQPHLAAGVRGQEVVWSVGCLEGNPRCVCGEKKDSSVHQQEEEAETEVKKHENHLKLRDVRLALGHLDVWLERNIQVCLNRSSSPCGRALLRPGVIMNCRRTPAAAAVAVLKLPRCRNTEPLDPLAANSVVRSLKVISLKGPLPRTADRRPR